MGNTLRIIALCLLVCFMNAPLASQEKIVEGGKTYYLHKVEKGQGFYRLSVIYGIAQKDIIDANPDLALAGLKEGSVVKIPAPVSVSQTPKIVSSGVKYISHKVEQGQTLYFISRKYDVSVDKLIELNPGCDQQLVVGSNIRVPSDISAASVPVQSDAQAGDNRAEKTKQDENYLFHTVQAGETLYRIAQIYQVSVSNILSANPVLDGNALGVGSKVRIPKNIEAKGGKHSENPGFVFHVVEAGETLFSISQKYGRSPMEIKLVNNDLNTVPVSMIVLSIGQELRIPREKLNLQLNQKSLFIKHEVKKKETFYGITKTYGVDVDVLKLVNPSMDFLSIRKGDELVVPLPSWYKSLAKVSEDEYVDDVPAKKLTDLMEPGDCGSYDYFIERPKINVALMMPFDAGGYQLVKNTPDSLRSDFHRALASKGKNYVEFYEGVLLALDSLKKEGVSVKLFVYDTQRDSTNIDRLLRRPEMGNMNLIVGPASLNNMRSVAAFAQEKRIPAVFPFSVMDGSIRNNPFVYQASPIDTLVRQNSVAQMMADAAGKRLVILTVDGNSNFEKSVLSSIRQKQAEGGPAPAEIVFHRYSQKDIASIDELLHKDKDNLVLITSIDESRVSRILTNLGLMSDRTKHQLTILGFAEWLKFQTVEPEDLHKLNVCVYSSYGADYKSVQCGRFASAYREWFSAEPLSFNPYFQRYGAQSGYSRFGMWGYDVTLFFVSAVKKFGPRFSNCVGNYHPDLLQSNFRFTHLTNWGGAYNSGLIRIQFARDFQIRVQRSN